MTHGAVMAMTGRSLQSLFYKKVKCFKMGMIYKRNKTSWIKYYRNCKPYRESTRSKIEFAARRLLKNCDGEIADGKLRDIHFDKATYDDLKAELLTDYELHRRKSIIRIKLSLSYLDKEFKGMKVVNIDSAKIKNYID